MSIYTHIKSTPWLWRPLSKLRYLPGLHWLWRRSFPGSETHWQRHYERGGDSGPGSYAHFAEYKARLINEGIRAHGIRSVIELGCGDGNQLSFLDIDEYIGLDVSKVAIERCRQRYAGTPTRSFIWYDQNHFHDPLHVVSADCAMSLDVIFHLVEDETFAGYMRNLFGCARRFVMIYALDAADAGRGHVSVRHRKYSDFVAGQFPDFRVVQHVPASGNYHDFYIYERLAKG